jgi:hypothetical protein
MILGEVGAGHSFLDTDEIAPPHYMVRNNLLHVQQLAKEIATSTQVATERLTELRTMTNEKINRTRVNKIFEKNDYVFVLDRAKTPGATRPLKTKLQASPYIVLKSLHTTCLVKRLADGFTALYSNNHIKKYTGGSPLFLHLPPEVTNVLLHKFTDLLASDLTKLTKFDPLDLPNGIPLHDLESGESLLPKDEDTIESSKDEDPLVTDPDLTKLIQGVEQDKLLKDLIDLQDETQIEHESSGSSDSDSDSEEGDVSLKVRRSKRGKGKNKKVRFT